MTTRVKSSIYQIKIRFSSVQTLLPFLFGCKTDVPPPLQNDPQYLVPHSTDTQSLARGTPYCAMSTLDIVVQVR